MLLTSLVSIAVLGILAQWIAWRLRIPSILLLLIFGFVAGPLTHFLHPDELFGELLTPIVSLSVGIILFEGGLTLKFKEIREREKVVRNLNSISVVITWVLITVAARYILGLDWALALLFGAILVVTGPTVIGPLLRHVGPIGPAGSILKWEGILIDPIGATLALLVFQAIGGGGLALLPTEGTMNFLRTLFVGVGIGLLGVWPIIIALRQKAMPDFLQIPMVLMLVMAAFAISNAMQEESGLLATTIMGIVLANTENINTRHILEFKENISVLLISSLFIILSARLDLELILSVVNAQSLIFLLFLLLVVRPLSVFAATYGSNLSWQERAFIAWLAPRGIVAAAVTSIFAFELSEHGFPDATRLVPLVFFVIVGTVAVYGLTAVPVARMLGLVKAQAPGWLIVGAHDWALELAQTLERFGQRVLLVDMNAAHVQKAEDAGLKALHGSILAEHIEQRVGLEELGHFLALTSNDQVNSEAVRNYAYLFGEEEVYQLVPRYELTTDEIVGRQLFSPFATSAYFREQVNAGANILSTPIDQENSYEAFKEGHPNALPLLIVSANQIVKVITPEMEVAPQVGETLVSLAIPSEAS